MARLRRDLPQSSTTTQPGEAPPPEAATPLVDRRRPARLPVELPLAIKHPTGHFQAVALNLGVGGVFIEASTELAYGTKLLVLIQLPKRPAPLALPGLVRWQNRTGFGVQFLGLGAHATYELSAFTARLT